MSLHAIGTVLQDAATGGDLLAGRAHEDRVLRALADIYGDAACLVSSPQWCGDRIYVLDAPGIPRQSRWPALTLAPDLRDDQRETFARAGTVEFRVLLTLHMDSYRPEIGADAVGPASVHRYFVAWLYSTQARRHLAVPRYGSRPLLVQPPTVGAWDVGTIVDGTDDEAEDGVSTHRYLELTLSATWDVEASTGQPQGWAGTD